MGHFNVAAIHDRRNLPGKQKERGAHGTPPQRNVPSRHSLSHSAKSETAALKQYYSNVAPGTGKIVFHNVARKVLSQIAMSFLESTDKTMAPPLQQSGGENRRENRKPDSDGQMSYTLAHELNNILTVVQGHADRLFLKHREDSALAPALKTISEAAHRAAELIRNASKLNPTPPSS